MKRILFISLLFLLCFQLFSQENPTRSDTLRKDALNVFMEASDYIRKEIPYVNYVRDIKDAGVYIISTSQNTGSGGREFTYYLVGQNGFAGMRDTVSFVTTPDETTEGRREKEVNTLKMGLVRYVARTPLSKYVKITFSEPLSETVSSDIWNSWVFSTSLGGFLNGQKTYKSSDIFGNMSARRITEKSKNEFNLDYSRGDQTYVLSDSAGTKITSTNRSKSFNYMYVKSLNNHWSIGGSTNIGSYTFTNHDIRIGLAPGIEYDIFPYSESTRRQLRILYSAGFEYNNYTDTTIYDKLEEGLWLHSLTGAYEVVQKWGSIDVSISWRNYFFDWSKNNLSLNGSVSLRIAKGLSVSMGGGASLVHDQLSLSKKDMNQADVLLKRREQGTQYTYFTYFNLSYTFGSIYNNVVNPRFGNRGGGGMMITIN
jgi:hypothetical protein